MSSRPNILLITSDQQHHAALGAHTPGLQTPALDRLADEGTLFERAYCNNPVCSPSRATIITGQYPAWHGCWNIGVKLAEDVPTVGSILGGAGYATSLIGKAHFQPTASTPNQTSVECHPTLRDLAFWRGFHGPYYGFDHIEITRNHGDEPQVGAHYGVWLAEHGVTDFDRYFRPWPRRPVPRPPRRGAWDIPVELHYSTWTGERTIAAIERAVAAERPFFCWASFADPHPPYLVPEPYASMYAPNEVEPGQFRSGELAAMPPWFAQTQEESPDFSPWQETEHPGVGFTSHLVDDDELRQNIALYYGMLTFLDQQVGRILDRLDALGVAENTLVVFTTDHGHFLGHHGLTNKGPFHYEDMLRVPMLARFPGHIPPGRRSRTLQGLVDLAPTFLTAAGLEVPPQMQGVNQLATWTGTRDRTREHVIVENRHQPTALHLRTYIEDRYKLTVCRHQPYGELFDLHTDPEERHNRFDDPDYALIKAQLMHRFLQAEIAREPMRYPRIAFA